MKIKISKIIDYLIFIIAILAIASYITIYISHSKDHSMSSSATLLISFLSFCVGYFGFNIPYIMRHAEDRKNERYRTFKKDTQNVTDIKKLDMYKLLFSFYNKKPPKLHENYKDLKWHYVDKAYLKGILGDLIDNDDEDYYKFPIWMYDEWCLSKNQHFHIKIKKPYEITQSKKSEIVKNNKSLFQKKFNKLSKRYTGYDDFAKWMRKELDALLTNSDTYNLCALNYKDNKLELDFCMCKYKAYININELINKELIFASQEKMGYNSLKARMKYGNYLLNFNENPITIGLNVFTIIKAKAKYYTLIQRRNNEKLSEYPSTTHVVPAGTFQPQPDHQKYYIEQCDLAYTVLREFLEEIFFQDIVREPNNLNSSVFLQRNFKLTNKISIKDKIFRLNDFLKFNKKSLSKGKNYNIIPTSFHIDLTTLKPQISLVLYIDSDELMDVLNSYSIGSEQEGSVEMYELGSKDFKNFIKENLNIEHFTPTGSISLAEGYYCYKNIDTIRKQQLGL